jgi:ankyrin repeat protein
MSSGAYTLHPLASSSFFIEAGEKVDKADIFGWTILYRAVTQRKRSVVDVLLAAGADTNIQNIKGRTVLHLAVDQRDGSLIDALLEAGADGNIQDKEGRTPLHLAARQLANNWLLVN